MFAPFAANALKGSGPLGAGYVSCRHGFNTCTKLRGGEENPYTLHVMHPFLKLFKNDFSLSLVHASRAVHTSSQSLAPVPPLPEKGGKVRHGIFPEELFQLLYPKTGVTGEQL